MVPRGWISLTLEGVKLLRHSLNVLIERSQQYDYGPAEGQAVVQMFLTPRGCTPSTMWSPDICLGVHSYPQDESYESNQAGAKMQHLSTRFGWSLVKMFMVLWVSKTRWPSDFSDSSVTHTLKFAVYSLCGNNIWYRCSWSPEEHFCETRRFHWCTSLYIHIHEKSQSFLNRFKQFGPDVHAFQTITNISPSHQVFSSSRPPLKIIKYIIFVHLHQAQSVQ